jgi:hypothetical protein
MSSVPPIPDFIEGSIGTLDQLQQLSTALDFLYGPPIAKLRQTSPQTLTTGVNTAINWSIADWDENQEGTVHWSAGTPSRFVSRYPGKYAVGGGCGFVANGTGFRLVRFAVNGVSATGGDSLLPNVGAGISARIPARYQELYLTVGDYVEMFATQNSGGNLDTSTASDEAPAMSIHWISR